MEIKEQLEVNKILILEDKVRVLQHRVNTLEIQLRDKKRDYDELLKRYIKQNNELILLMLEHPKEKRGV